MRIFRSTTLDSNANTYVGDYSTLFVGNDYVLRISDNTTPGGVTIQGSEGVVQSATPPDDPTPNSLWYNTDTGRLYVYYEGVWVDAAPALAGPTGPTGPTGTGATGPTGPASTGDITFTGNVIGSSNGNIVIDTALVPSGNATIDLGTIDNQWRSLYVSGQTVYLAGVPLSVSDGNTLSFGNTVVATSSNVPTTVTGNITFSNTTIGTVNTDSDVNINVMFDGNAHVWTFGADGGTTFPTLTVPISDSASPSGTGQTIKFSDSSQQAIIYGPASTSEFLDAERIIIQGAPGYTGTTGEGGDVYLWAGPGGSTNGDGGDIKVRAGYGPGTGQGGYLNFQAGDSADGAGGHINIESGQSGTYGSGGYITVTARSGGDIDVVAEGGGKITLITDAEGGYGYNNWQFGNSGNLTLPGGGIITDSAETVIISGAGTSAVNQTYGKIFTGQYIGQTDSVYVIDPPEAPSTTYKLRIPEDAGGLYESEDLVTWTIVAGAGGGTAPAPTGVIVAQHITVTVDSSDWTFDSTGNLTVPAGGTINFSDGSNALAGTGNVTFENINVIGTGNLNLQPDPNDSSAYLDIYQTAGPDIHIAGNGQNLILGRDDGANVSVNTSGNVTIQTDVGTPQVWTFGNDGVLTLPASGGIVNNGNTWTFGADGNTVFPTNISIDYSGGNDQFPRIIADSEKAFSVQGQGASGSAALAWTVDPNAAGQYAQIGVTKNGGDNLAKVILTAQSDSSNVATAKIWQFDETGNLTLPPGGNINAAPTVDYGDGNSIVLTAGSTTGCVHVGGSVILNAGSGGASGGIERGGNILLNTNSGTWAFGNDGNLTFPTGNLVITDDNASLGNAAVISSADHNLITLSTGVNGGTSSLWVEDYASIGTSNIAAVYSNPVPGSAIVRIVAGQNGGPGPNLWDFGADGTLTTPGNITLPNGAVLKDTAGDAVAFGENAGATNQGLYAVAIGETAGNTSQGLYGVAVGQEAGSNTQGYGAVAVGSSAGYDTQGTQAVAIGIYAGYITQSANAVAVGQMAGHTSQGTQSVAIGNESGKTSQGIYSVAVGFQSGFTGQGNSAVAVGYYAGANTQGNNSVAIGTGAGETTQGNLAVAIGPGAGSATQGIYSVAVGPGAGETTQGNSAVAFGQEAGLTSQGDYAVAIGKNAGTTSQGVYAVAIGAEAGLTSQGDNSIIINATGSALNQTTANTFTVKPVRAVTSVTFTAPTSGSIPAGFSPMYYNPTTGEIIVITP